MRLVRYQVIFDGRRLEVCAQQELQLRSTLVGGGACRTGVADYIRHTR